MKYIVCILIIVTNLNGCNAQKTTKMEQEFIVPQVTKELEKFDIGSFNKEVDEISGKRILNTEENYIEEDYQDPGYSRVIYNDSHSFYILKLFFDNGDIHKKGIMFNNGSNYGIWYEYNEEGKLISETNTDEGYDFDWQKIVEYCEKNSIKLTKGQPKSGGVDTEIYQNELEDRKVWQLTYYNYDTEQLFEVILDGKTGEELKKRELEFIGG